MNCSYDASAPNDKDLHGPWKREFIQWNVQAGLTDVNSTGDILCIII